MMLALGPGLVGGRMVADWPGLHPDQQVGPGDLAITIDYLVVLAEILSVRLNNPLLEDIFPGYQVVPRGIVARR